MDKIETSSKKANIMRYTQNRELSWLNFNKRVLEMGEDEGTPLFERLKFVAIFQSNLSEFFMIRVGALHDLASLKNTVHDNKSHMTPEEQLDAIFPQVTLLEELRDVIFSGIERQLEAQGIRRHTWNTLSAEQQDFVTNYFEQYVSPTLSPQIIDSVHPFPHLQNGMLYVAAEMSLKMLPTTNKEPEQSVKSENKNKGNKAKGGKKKQKGAASLVGIVPVSTMVPRMLKLPSEDLEYILIEEIIAHFLPEIFDMYTVSTPVPILVTRNSDINPDDETYDDDSDYRQHMKKILKKRKRLAPVRLMAQGELGKMNKFLRKQLNIKKTQVYTLKSPLDLSYVYTLEDELSPQQAHELLYIPYTPVTPEGVAEDVSMFDQVRSHDIMISLPFDSLDPFVAMLKEAATDPEVVSIKITLYRMAKVSKIAEYLIAAAENGKDVVALLELRARFDEEANIGWAERFEEAGITVLYGFEGYKVHSKICQIARRKGRGIELFTQLSTGNYNEKTAKQYTDISIITADDGIGFDGVEFFNNMAVGNLNGEYKHFIVSPTSFKSSIMDCIDEEIAKAQAGLDSSIIIKCNSVTDIDLINKLSEASNEGVNVQLIVRGICCLLPKIPDSTDNVSVISIVGRLLEHSRIYCFGAGDDVKIYLASADMMTRNTERRVEIGFPIYDARIKERLVDMLKMLLSDSANAQALRRDGSYVKVNAPEGTDPISSQQYFMDEATQRQIIVVDDAAASSDSTGSSPAAKSAVTSDEFGQRNDTEVDLDEPSSNPTHQWFNGEKVREIEIPTEKPEGFFLQLVHKVFGRINKVANSSTKLLGSGKNK